MIIVAGHLRVAAAERGQYLKAVERVAIEARQAPGCLDFAQSADEIDPERINVYERWDDDDSLAAFRASGEKSAPLATPAIRAAEVAKYRISTVEAP